MKKLKFKWLESYLLLLIAFIIFFTVEAVLPKYLVSIIIILIAFYFFPIKLFLNKIKEFSKLLLMSDIIISISLSLLIVGFYIENKAIITVFAIANFFYLIFFAFQFKNNTTNDRFIYQKIIINHFIISFMLQMVK